MKIDFWGHKRKNGLKKDTAIVLSCYCVIRDGGMGKMPGKSGKHFLGAKGVDWVGFGGSSCRKQKWKS